MSLPTATTPAARPDHRGDRERTLFVRALLTRAVHVRLHLAVVCLAMGVFDAAYNVVPGRWQLLVGGSLVVLLANELLAQLNRRGAADERHLWGMQLLDTTMIGMLVVSFGALGYLGIPFAIYSASSYAMGHPRAAMSQYLMVLIVYPASRFAGVYAFRGDVSPWPVVMETLCVGVIGWMSMQGPERYTRRVRRARQALGALERGDFSVRLPTKALDDVGFLGISFNATAEALGNAIRTLEDEVEERARAEESMRAARHEATRIAERMAAVAEAAGEVLAAGSVEALQEVLREASAHVLDTADLTLVPLDETTGTLLVADPSPADGASIPLPTPAAVGQLLTTRRTLVTTGEESATSGGALMRTPVTAGLEVAAVMSVRTDRPRAFSGADVAVFEALAALAATALRNMLLVDELRASHEALSHQAHHDGLTGLPNRRRFRERVLQALRESPAEQVAVLALDLDGFKDVNDSLGHAAGDQVLQQVAERLLNATRGSDLVARLGGDEFAVVLSHVPDEAHAVVVAERLLRAVQSPFTVSNRVVTLGTCIGIAFGSERAIVSTGAPGPSKGKHAPSGDAVDLLLHDADVALYRAKSSGKSCWVIFEPSMHDAETTRRRLEADVRLAVAREQVALDYQPIHELDGGALRGLEAQLRWEHPERGIVAPALWLPIAEETGLLAVLGRWALARACSAAATWSACPRPHDPSREPLAVAVPVSARQLEDPGFADAVRAELARVGVPPHALVLQLSEGALQRSSAEARDQLQRLRQAGTKVAIDDFGTGASSLDYLEGFPVDILKIDRSFTQGVSRGGSQTALARTIIALGNALGLETLAKGVDHEPQRASLHALGCRLGQGARFASPMSEEEITALVAGRVGV